MYQLLSQPYHHCRSPSSGQMDDLLLLLESTYIKDSSIDNFTSSGSTNGDNTPNSTDLQQQQPQQLQLVIKSFDNNMTQNDELAGQDEKECETEEEEEEYESEEDESESEDEESMSEDSYQSESEEEENIDSDNESNSSLSESEEHSYNSDVSDSESENEEKVIVTKKNRKHKPFGLIRPSMIYKYGNSSDSDNESEEDSSSESEEDGSQESDEDLINQFEDLIPNYSFSCPTITTTDLSNQNENSSSTNQYEDLDNYYDDEEELSQEYKNKSRLLQLERDRDILSSIRSSSPNPIRFIPTWFGDEDETQIRIIVQEYQDYIFKEYDIDANCVRAPKPFIGRIHRRAIQLTDNLNEFSTIDTVKVYRWEIQPIGRPLNLYKSFVILTHWDAEAGVPTSFQKILSLSDKTVWQEQYKSSLLISPSSSSTSLSTLTSRNGFQKSSYIYCSPIFDRENEYQFSVDNDKYPIDFLPKSSPKASMRRNSSHPSLLLNSRIYSHSLIPQGEFNFKNLKNLDDCNSDFN